MNEATMAYVDERQQLATRLKQIIVERLDLPLDPDWITDDQPLFGRGLELDSVDALELVASFEYEFDVVMEDGNISMFGSINSLIDFLKDEDNRGLKTYGEGISHA